MPPAIRTPRAPRGRRGNAARALTLVVRGAQVALALLGALSWVVA